MEYTTVFDANSFLTASMDKVFTTFLEAFFLVFVVVFVFLQDWRSTLIPAIAVPVSIIGTFFFLNLFGYSVNPAHPLCPGAGDRVLWWMMRSSWSRLFTPSSKRAPIPAWRPPWKE
ncbi:MAG: efflux RND transporter permease subunit [Balneolaceae bacterium]|nr:efflux RND transporter permease subunit [Balneolaceae bacterium]